MDEFGTDGMELTPSASSNKPNEYQRDPSVASFSNKIRQNRSDEDLLDGHYDQIMSQQKQGYARNMNAGENTPGFNSVNDSMLPSLNNTMPNLNIQQQSQLIQKLTSKCS